MAIPFQPSSPVCAYLRDSGGADQDLSVEQQEAELRAWCSANNLILTRVFRDVAISGSSVIGRDSFLEMITYFRNKPEERGLVIWRFSRFARNMDDAWFFKADLRRRGYEIHSIKDQIPDGSTGRFFEAALDWMNARFLEDLSLDVKRGQQHLVTQYGALGGHPPIGYCRELMTIGVHRDGRPHIVARWVLDHSDPELLGRIRLAWEMRASGILYAEILEKTRLFQTERGYSRFFRNAIYKGELRFSGRSFSGYCEALVDEDTWDRVQTKHRHSRKKMYNVSN